MNDAPYAAAAIAAVLTGAGFEGRSPLVGIDWMPATPDLVVAVFENPGPGLVYSFERALSSNVRIQVQARSGPGDRMGARYLAARAFSLLANLVDRTVTAAELAVLAPSLAPEDRRDVWLQSLAASHAPALLGADDKDRPIYALNFDATVALP